MHMCANTNKKNWIRIIFLNVHVSAENKKRRKLRFFPWLLTTRPVWTGFKIAVRQKHYKTRLYTPYKKAIVNIIALLKIKMERWMDGYKKGFDTKQ